MRDWASSGGTQSTPDKMKILGNWRQIAHPKSKLLTLHNQIAKNSETLSQLDTSSLVAPEYTLGANWPCCSVKKTKPSSCSVKECHIADFFCRRAAGHRIGLLGNETNCTCSRWVFLDWFFLGKSSEILWKYFIIVFGPASAKEMRFLSSFLKLHN